MILFIIRKIMGIKQPKIDKRGAITIAHQHCEKHGILISNPNAVEQLRTWLIWVNGNVVGSTWLVIDQQTGEIIRKGTPPR